MNTGGAAHKLVDARRRWSNYEALVSSGPDLPYTPARLIKAGKREETSRCKGGRELKERGGPHGTTRRDLLASNTLIASLPGAVCAQTGPVVREPRGGLGGVAWRGRGSLGRGDATGRSLEHRSPTHMHGAFNTTGAADLFGPSLPCSLRPLREFTTFEKTRAS
ncbi:hypothetical protein E2C01_047829 [Portunus trituberculatus]|uniref:Uncharacterized protein n=1 Tax=Portunus trituberculatus TaxID=210409 RepID=A0A5B7G8X4_PORTR|nr:hypothetical protein [Portunus trituberculatus]